MKNIAIVFGGFSSEYEVSIKSAKFIYDNLKDNSNWNVFQICISKKKNTVKFKERIFDLDYHSFTFNIDGKIIKPDAVYNIIHGDPGENGVLAEILEKNEIPQTSCNNYVSELTFYKKKYIKFVDSINIPCPKQVLLKRKDLISISRILEAIKIPCIVKPNNGGSSIGVSKVNYSDELENKIKIAFNEGDEVLIENFLDGQEVSVGVLEINGKELSFQLQKLLVIMNCLIIMQNILVSHKKLLQEISQINQKN